MGSDEVGIFGFGPYITTHHRHFRQQAQYTMALIYGHNERAGKLTWSLASPEDVQPIAGARQDVLWKINLPFSEATKVIEFLDRANVNAYSLYGDEESLLELMAYRELSPAR